MIYTLYSAVDLRDGKPMLWLTRRPDIGCVPIVALFKQDTHPAYIKRLTLVSPDSIFWHVAASGEPDNLAKHADVGTLKLIDEWTAVE